ncbi:hypothetical protein JTB14_029924 [Gonioctena quinquepunctata]|nr:hypothetical protein JTB14_029924 [Gonioctena quinquepunctata]
MSTCMIQSWYLACDMHYFLLLPVLIISLQKWPRLGVSMVIGIIIASIITVFTTVYINEGDAIVLFYFRFLKDPVGTESFQNYYIPSHMRASTYFVGVLAGFIKFQMKKTNYVMPKYIYWAGWILAISISASTIQLGFIFYEPDIAKLSIVSAIYASMHRFTFSIGVAWIIFAVSSGKGQWIEPLLSWKPFIVLSRINYTTFLCHAAIQIYTVASLREPNYAQQFLTLHTSFGDIVMAYLFGFLLSMFIEVPVMGLEKILFGRPTSDKEKENETKPTTLSGTKIEVEPSIVVA